MPSQQLSDWWTRAGAFLLDQLIVAGVAVGLGLLTAEIAGDPSDETRELAVYGVAFVLSVLYAPLLMMRRGGRNGQTVGKQLLGIRVVRADGAPVNFGTGVMRTVLGQQLPTAATLYLYAFADYLWPLRDARRQALHDKLAKTWVVCAPASAPSPPDPFGAPLREPDEVPVQGWLPPRAPGA